MSSQSPTIEEVLTRMAAAPPRLAKLTAGLTESQLQAVPSHGEWSANEVLAHLRSCADVWGKYMLIILQQDAPTFRAVSPRTWIKNTNYLEQKFKPSLQAFTKQRTELLAVLESLAPKDWSRTALVTGVRKPLEKTVLSYAQRLVIHEQPHLNQIERSVNVLRR